MKKVFTLVLLALIVATSLVTGTLAIYTVEAPELTGGDIIAKQFVFTSAGKEGFSSDVKIAPTERVIKEFTVANYNGDIVSETGMLVTITVEVAGGIEPLSIEVKGGLGEQSVIQNNGTTSTIELTIPANQKALRSFRVIVIWESTNNDIDFMGETSYITVTATATQAPNNVTH